MPQATNLVLKNAANADKTFTLLAPAAGYMSVAEWALREGTTSTVYPRLTLQAVRTSNKSRKVALRVLVPAAYTSVSTGLPVVSSTLAFHGSITVPDDFPEAQKDDFVAYVAAFLNAPLVRSCYRDGLPAT